MSLFFKLKGEWGEEKRSETREQTIFIFVLLFKPIFHPLFLQKEEEEKKVKEGKEREQNLIDKHAWYRLQMDNQVITY